jgi:phenylacetate-CoA ligase
MTFIPVRPERLILPVFETVENNVKEINCFSPDIIISFGSYLEALFRTLDVIGLEMLLPSGVVCIGDGMTGEGKIFIEEKFGIPVLSIYNAGEAFKIGFSCEERLGFHVHEDLCHVRIVDEAGEEMERGERGEVVISNLINHGTVLLNYRLGDLASMPDKRCPCGRTQPLLSELEGRVQDVIYRQREPLFTRIQY